MLKRTGFVLTLLLCGAMLIVTGCASDASIDKGKSSDESAATAQADAEASNVERESEVTEGEDPAETAPLPDEQLYFDLLATGLDFSYGLTPADGSIEILENMEGYAALRWTDAQGRSILVVRRYVADEPEDWTYDDEGVRADGITPNKPTQEQLNRYLALAQEIVDVTDSTGVPSLFYSWTSGTGLGSAVYSTTEDTTDDPNLHISFGDDEVLARMDYTIPLP